VINKYQMNLISAMAFVLERTKLVPLILRRRVVVAAWNRVPEAVMPPTYAVREACAPAMVLVCLHVLNLAFVTTIAVTSVETFVYQYAVIVALMAMSLTRMHPKTAVMPETLLGAEEVCALQKLMFAADVNARKIRDAVSLSQPRRFIRKYSRLRQEVIYTQCPCYIVQLALRISSDLLLRTTLLFLANSWLCLLALPQLF
jgi:hypothetical protein